MSFRKEFKFPLTQYELMELKKNLFETGMVTLFPHRNISSIYFDNQSFAAFTDSEEGVLPRKKLRCRSYNNIQKFFFETKWSTIEGRYKSVYELSKHKADLFFNTGFVDALYGLVLPVVRVDYKRSYYNYNGLRVTIDTSIKYHQTSTGICRLEPYNVLEVKCTENVSDDLVSYLFPVPIRRFSKYCRGIDAAYF